MRNIMIIGANIRLNGCQLLRLHEVDFILTKAGLDLKEAVEGLQKVSQRCIIKNEDLQSLIVTTGKALGPFHLPVKEKKPKYIRQQHKLAQRHYRRK